MDKILNYIFIGFAFTFILDYLSLNYDGHVRCRFVIENDVVKSSDWIAP